MVEKNMQKNKIKVIDNFLSDNEYQKIYHLLLKDGILNWKYNDEKVNVQQKKGEQNDYQFTHLFYNFHSLQETRHVTSPQIDFLIPLVKKLRFIALYRIKANLEPLKTDRYKSHYHYDVAMDGKPCPFMTTGIYYVNTNDGYTEFETGDKVKSIANRFVKFPSDILHRGVSQLDTKVRCVLNCNYFEFP